MVLEWADRSLASKERLLKRVEAQNRCIIMRRWLGIEQMSTTKRRGWKVLRQSIEEAQRAASCIMPIEETAAYGIHDTGSDPLERMWKAKSLRWKLMFDIRKAKLDARARRFTS